MKRASRKLIRDSGETTDQSETAAQFLEDLAAHADNDDKEKQLCLTAAKNFPELLAQGPSIYRNSIMLIDYHTISILFAGIARGAKLRCLFGVG